jgi:hypothetical protein
MASSNYTDTTLFKLYQEWRGLIKRRSMLDHDTPERAEIDAIYNRVLPLVSMASNPDFLSQAELLAKTALKILEKQDKP